MPVIRLRTHLRTCTPNLWDAMCPPLMPLDDLSGALDSQAGISRGTPNTKRCFRNAIECWTGTVGHSIWLINCISGIQSSVRPVRWDTRLGFESTVWCSNRGMPNGPLELQSFLFGVSRDIPACESSAPTVGNFEIISVYRGTSRPCELSAPIRVSRTYLHTLGGLTLSI